MASLQISIPWLYSISANWPKIEQLGHVVLAAECCEHAGEVAEGRERRLEPFADVLVGRGAPEIFVAVRSEGLRNDRQLTLVGGQLDWLVGFGAGERRFASVGLARAELGQRGVEAAQVVLPHGRSDVDPEGDLVGAVRDDAGECLRR